MGYSNGLYVEVNLVCFLVLLKIFQKLYRDFDRQYEKKIFGNVLIASLIFIFSDMGWVFLGYLCPQNITASYVVNIIYFLFSGGIGFSWMYFAEIKMGYDLRQYKILRVICMIPFLLLIVLTLTSPVFHGIFYIDENNGYHRGPFHILQVLCMNIYFAIPCVQAMIKSFDKNDLANKSQYISICLLIIWTMSAQLIQVFIPGYPTISIGLTISLLNVFIELRDSVISLDALTQINNRNQMLKFLATKLRKSIDDSNLYLLIMDIDYFKTINDTFGHIEGDNALKTLAGGLKKCAGKFNSFICRYGGDEFIMICENKTETEVAEICSTIKETIFNDNANQNKPYELNVSVGYAKRSSDCNTIADLIKAADGQLYIQKENRKKPVKGRKRI